jgi:hypothetical protein
MNNEKVIYETGATSHAVNDLILFTDNTRALVEQRDNIYKKMIRYTADIDLETKWFSDWNKLLLCAAREYRKIFPNYKDHKHINHIKSLSFDCGTWTDEQTREYIMIYINDFENWKKEHGYK